MKTGWLLVFCACGRLDFDPIATHDAVADCTPSPEICNAIDDDCDGLVDESCPCTPFDMTVAQASSARSPLLAWDGTTYYIGYQASTGIEIQRLDASGQSLGAISLSASNYQADFGGRSLYVTGGTVFALLSKQPSAGALALELARFDLSGAFLGETELVPTTVGFSFAALVPSPTGLAAAWIDARTGTSQLYLAPFALDGTPQGSDVLVSDGVDAPVVAPALVRVPSGYALAWVDQQAGEFRGMLARYDERSGAIDRVPVLSTAQFPASTDLAWTGTSFVIDIVYSNAPTDRRAVDTSYMPLGASTAMDLTEVTGPSLAWTGSWIDEASISSTFVTQDTVTYSLRRIAADATVLSQPTVLATASAASFMYARPTALADASRSAVALLWTAGGSTLQVELHQRCP